MDDDDEVLDEEENEGEESEERINEESNEPDIEKFTIKVTNNEPFTNPLSLDHMKKGLARIERLDFKHCHAFTYFQLFEKRITCIELLASYPYLRVIRLSNNLITDFSPISLCQSLLYLDIDHNIIEHAGQLSPLKYFQKMNLSNNKIGDINDIIQPALEFLNLNNNDIDSLMQGNSTVMTHEGLPHLKVLEIRGNKLETTEGIGPHINIERLYLAQNRITKLVEIDKLVNLKILHLRSNKLKTFEIEGINKLISLEYLNLRGNFLKRYLELKKLVSCISLKRLNLSENPISEKEDYRQCIIGLLTNINILDKEKVSKSERREALEYIENKDFEQEDNAENDEATEEAENEEEAQIEDEEDE